MLRRMMQRFLRRQLAARLQFLDMAVIARELHEPSLPEQIDAAVAGPHVTACAIARREQHHRAADARYHAAAPPPRATFVHVEKPRARIARSRPPGRSTPIPGPGSRSPSGSPDRRPRVRPCHRRRPIGRARAASSSASSLICRTQPVSVRAAEVHRNSVLKVTATSGILGGAASGARRGRSRSLCTNARPKRILICTVQPARFPATELGLTVSVAPLPVLLTATF